MNTELQSTGHLYPLPARDHNLQTGPAVEKRVPDFQVIDHRGQKQTFDTLRGRNGLVMLFHRSADW